jgi:hypothetical protein
MAAIDVDEYRKRYQRSVEAATPKGRPRGSSTTGRSGRTGLAAAADTAAGPGDIGTQVQGLLATALDRTHPVDDRLAAIQALSALEFQGPRFSPYQAEYVDALRTLATDPRATVRRSALEQLAFRQDPYARDLLTHGLEKPADALVPEAVALQYLGHDGHGDAVPIARKVYRRATGAAREEALRILATDPKSEAMLERLMKDKDEKSAIRRLSAAALQELNPERFDRAARRIVADDDEFNEIRSTSLTGLAMQAPADAPAADDTFVQTVAELHKSTRSPAVKASTTNFLRASDVEIDDL